MFTSYHPMNRYFKDAEKSLQYFGDMRTDKNVGKTFQGVETASQQRYVAYYEKWFKKQPTPLVHIEDPPAPEVELTEFVITGILKRVHGDLII